MHNAAYRRTRSATHTSLALILIAGLLSALLIAAPRAQAAGFDLSACDPNPLVNGNNLIIVITVASNNGASDTIQLGACVYRLSGVDNTIGGANGLPSIQADGGSTLAIRGASAATTIIERAAGSESSFRIFHIAAGASVTISDLTIRNGLARGTNGLSGETATDGGDGVGGAIYNQATLALTNVILEGNRAVGGTGGTSMNTNTESGVAGMGLGGAIMNSAKSSLDLNEVILRSNSATGGLAGNRTGVTASFSFGKVGGAGQGGAIYTEGALTMSGGALNDNQAIGGQSGTISGSATFLYGSSGADGYGGAIYAPAGSAELTTVQLDHNTIVGGAGGIGPNSTGSAGDGHGGAVYASAPLTIIGGVVTDNSVPDSNGGGGGALMIEGGETTIDNTSFQRNSSPGGYGGGALLVTSSTMTITTSLFDNNTGGTGGAIAAGGEGGPIAIQIQNSMFISNTAEYEGGAASLFGDFFTISGSTFANNQSTNVEASGGAIASQGSLEISNSTISGNRSRGSGGGLSVRGGNAALDHVTISGNTADSAGTDSGDGGGLEINATTTIANTIVAGNFDAPSNSGGETTAPDVSGEFTSGGYNLIGDGTGGSGFTNGTNGDQVGTAASRIDPLLGALGTNGGTTLTRALLPGSPAIDAGDPAFAPPPNDDQRGAGFSRVGNGRTDIGAFEVQGGARPIYSSVPAAPGPITIVGPASILASASISVTNIGDPLTSLYVLTATASIGFNVTPLSLGPLQPGDPPQPLVVTCTPSASGPQTGKLVVTTNEPGGPSYTYTLSCAAAIPGIVLTPSPLDFGDQPIGTTSAVRLVTLRSSGTVPLRVDSIATSGNFAIVASGAERACPASPPPFTLEPESSCTIGVSFTPSATGPRSGALRVADNAGGSPHSVALSGNGVPNPSQTIRRTFLPIMLMGGQSDLAITSLSISPNKPGYTAGEPVQISVTITNQGNAPTTSAFWVDLYVNPARPPTINTLWSDVCDNTPCVGVAWPVLTMLAPGQSITLTATRASYDQQRSFWLGWLPSGTTQIYALADSWNTSGSSGTIVEINEANNLAHIDGLTVTGTNPPYEPWPSIVRPDAATQPNALPARPLP